MTKVSGKGEFSAQGLTLVTNAARMSHAEGGAVLVGSTGTAPSAEYYGLSFGSTVPTSLSFTFGKYSGLYTVDGVSPTGGQAVSVAGGYFNAGEYCPLKFVTVTLVGAGFVKAYKK